VPNTSSIARSRYSSSRTISRSTTANADILPASQSAPAIPYRLGQPSRETRRPGSGTAPVLLWETPGAKKRSVPLARITHQE
jgi:hypothetical protein